MPTADIKSIAEGLSEAQRRCILAMKPGKDYRPKDIPARWSTLDALWWHETACLVVRILADDPPRHEWCLATDGLSVREYLEKHNG